MRFALLYTAAWIPGAAVYSAMIYLQSTPRSVSGAIIGGVESIVFAAILGLGVRRLTERLAERSRSIAALISVHTALAVAYALLWTTLISGSIYFYAPREVWNGYVQYAVPWQIMTGVFVYGMIAGVTHALFVTRRLRRERDAATKADALRVRAELSALRAQMNPHFLFNTLHSISALVRTDPAAVEDALERLALLLRRLLDVNRTGADQIALGEEWEIVRDQLELEKLRFGDRLSVVAELESDALECRVPIFTLQPLVENAVRHGVAARTQPCVVTVSARVREDVLTIQVGDDADGADPSAVGSAKGFGLSAVRQRLLAQYRDRASMRIDTAPGAGFRVIVTLPAVA